MSKRNRSDQNNKPARMSKAQIKEQQLKEARKKSIIRSFVFAGMAVVLAFAVAVVIQSIPPYTTEDLNPYDYSAGREENGSWEGVRALDFVPLTASDYMGIEIPFNVHTPSELEIDGAIQDVIAQEGFPAPFTRSYEGEIKDGDTVNIGYVGTVNGVAFENGSTDESGAMVTIGVTNYIDGFLEQLIGHKPGETVDVNVTFPEEYHAADLAGKPALFVVDINYIALTDSGEMDDAYVKEFFGNSEDDEDDESSEDSVAQEKYGYNTVAELRQAVHDQLREASINDFIKDYLMEKVEIKNPPKHMVNTIEKSMLEYFYKEAKDKQISLEEFIEEMDIKGGIRGCLKYYHDENQENAKTQLLMQAIVEAAGLTLSEEEFAEYYAEIKDGLTPEERKAKLGMPFLNQTAINAKAFRYVTENAVLLGE